MNIVNMWLLFLSFYVQLYMGCKILDLKFHINIKNLTIISLTSIIFNQLLGIKYIASYKVAFTAIFLIIILFTLAKKNILLVLETSFFILIVLILSESIVGTVIFNMMKINLNYVHSNSSITVIIDFLVYFLSIIIVNKKDIFIKIINKCYYVPSKYNITNLIFFLTVLSILVVTYILSYKSFSIDTFYILLLTSMLCSILIFTFFYNNYILRLKEEKFSELKLYTNIIEGLVDDVNKFKHDYNNILFMMKGYLDSNNFDELKKFFDTQLDIKYSYNEIQKLKKISDAGLRGLIASKIAQINSQNITVEIEIIDDINSFNMDMIDLCRILGIFIDNAYESAKESNDKFISISFSQDDSLNITIANSYNKESSINLSEIYKKNYSTKGKNHGIGLKNVKEIINKKYPNILLNTCLESKLFIQDLYISAN